MKIIWLGQAGFMIEMDNKIILIDPYLSDSVEKEEPWNKRRVPVNKDFLCIDPDIIVLTHSHLDHTDPETLKNYLDKDKKILVLAPLNSYDIVKKIGKNNNYILFNRHTLWSEGNIRFHAVHAEHSDVYSIGVIIEYKNKKYYFSGDTLYNTKIFNDIPKDIYVAFIPVNGTGNNMNMKDALLFKEKINAKITIPIHFGMFDNIKPIGFDVIPEIYKEIKL